MKAIIATIVSAFALTALTAFAAEPAKTAEVKPAVVAPTTKPAPVAVVGGDKGKAPVKSTVVKDEKAAAPAVVAAPAAKPASK